MFWLGLVVGVIVGVVGGALVLNYLLNKCFLGGGWLPW